MKEMYEKRFLTLDNAGIEIRASDNDDEKERTIKTAISSEQPYERYFGIEVLSHEKSAINMDRLESGRVPLLLEHKADQVIGVVEGVELGKDKILRADIRFSKNPLGDEVFKDYEDGIRSSFSIGYRVKEFEDVSKKGDEIPTYKATNFEILEVSAVSVPADTNAFVGRSAEAEINSNLNTKENTMSEDNKVVDTPNVESKEPQINVDEIRNEAADNEGKRVASIMGLGYKYNLQDAANEAVTEKRSVAEFQTYVLNNLEEKSNQPTPKPANYLDIEPKQNGKYMLLKAVGAALNGGNWGRNAGLEKEMSDEIAKRSDKEGVFVPTEIFSRASPQSSIVTAGTAGTGAELVGTNHRSDMYIDPLYNRAVVFAAGATSLPGLVGNVDIPKGDQTTPGVAWLSEEDSEFEEGVFQTSEISLTPKDIALFVQISRRAIQQSQPAVDALVRDDIRTQASLGIDSAALTGAGTGGVPQGIVGATGVNVVTSPAYSWAKLHEMIRDVHAGNLTGNAFIGNPYSTYALKTTVKVSSTDSVFLMNEDGNLVGYPYFETNQLANAGYGSPLGDALIFGNFHHLIIGSWGSIELATSDSDASNFRRGRVTVRVIGTVDVQIRYPEAFSTMVSLS